MGMKKKLRQIERKKQKDYENRRDLFIKKMKKASKETNIDVVAVIQAISEGIFPRIAFVNTPEKPKDIKPKLEV